MNLQDILKKFEYFPIHCKVFRAKENFKKYKKGQEKKKKEHDMIARSLGRESLLPAQKWLHAHEHLNPRKTKVLPLLLLNLYFVLFGSKRVS
jgi:hypothetical protein